MTQEIDDAKRAVDLANTTATRVNDALRPIKEQLDQWQQTYGDANATNDDINNALMEANKTGRSANVSELRLFSVFIFVSYKELLLFFN